MPASATASAGAPTRERSSRSVSRPTSKSSSTTPISASRKIAIGKRHEAEHRGTEEDTREQLAEHGGLPHALGELPEELRADERGGERQQDRPMSTPCSMARIVADPR